MHRINNTNIIKSARFLVAIGFAIVASCASTAYDDAEYYVDTREELRQLTCPGDTTAACIERIGKPTQCFCSHRDDLERILEPTK
jgi:hypothetical protein